MAAIEQDTAAFDLLFLDIPMGGMNGMELAQTLRKRNLRLSIVFLTICQDYLREEYRVQPLDYLLKPVNLEELKQVLEQLQGECFCRCHRCYAVNLSWVQYIERTQLTLQNGGTIPVGRKYHQMLQNALVHILNL